LKTNDIFKLETAKFVHKSINSKNPHIYQTIFARLQNHSRNARASITRMLSIPLFRTKRLQKSIKYHGTKLWNSISLKTKNTSFNVFQLKYREQLFRNFLSV